MVLVLLVLCVALWLLALFFFFFHVCPFVVLLLCSSIVTTLLVKRGWLLHFSLACGLCADYYRLFVLPLGVIGRLWSVIVAIPGHITKTCLFKYT